MSFTLPQKISCSKELELTSPLIIRAGRIGLVLSPHALGVLLEDDYDNNAARTKQVWPKNHDSYDEMGMIIPVGSPTERYQPNQYGTLAIALFTGEALRVGRRRGIEIASTDGLIDPALTDQAKSFYGAANIAIQLDATMSNSHFAAYVLAPNVIRIDDLGSTNGTFVMPLAEKN